MAEIQKPEIELIYVGNGYFQTAKRVKDDSPSGSDFWACYIPKTITREMGIIPEEHKSFVLSIKCLLAKEEAQDGR